MRGTRTTDHSPGVTHERQRGAAASEARPTPSPPLDRNGFPAYRRLWSAGDWLDRIRHDLNQMANEMDLDHEKGSKAAGWDEFVTDRIRRLRNEVAEIAGELNGVAHDHLGAPCYMLRTEDLLAAPWNKDRQLTGGD